MRVVSIMGRMHEIQDIKASKITSSKISNISTKTKTKIFYNNFIGGFVFTGMVCGA